MKIKKHIILLGVMLMFFLSCKTKNICPEKDLMLIEKLEKIHTEDYISRLNTRDAENRFGMNSEEQKILLKIQDSLDIIHLSFIKNVLKDKGWLGKEIIGEDGNYTLFLILQHSDLQTQVSYLPLMKKAFKRGNVNGEDLAVFEDRILIRTNKKQIYGSQLRKNSITNKFELFPIANPKRVDKRRKKRGMDSLREYIKDYGLNRDAY